MPSPQVSFWLVRPPIGAVPAAPPRIGPFLVIRRPGASTSSRSCTLLMPGAVVMSTLVPRLTALLRSPALVPQPAPGCALRLRIRAATSAGVAPPSCLELAPVAGRFGDVSVDTD